MLIVNYLLINIKQMKVTITEQHLHNIIAESVKSKLLEFNHMLYGSEPKPECRCGTLNVAEAVSDNSEYDLDYDYVTAVLNKYQLPTEISVCYPESSELDAKGKAQFKEICAKLESIQAEDEKEKAVLAEYLDAIFASEDYYDVYGYYRDELEVPEPDEPDYEYYPEDDLD